MTSPKKTYTGSCHCGFIKYRVALSLPTDEAPTATRCNCTICLKGGNANIRPASPEDFTLITPSSPAEVKDYQMRSPDIHRYFCGTCGIHVWAAGQYEFGGVVEKFFTVNLLTLDQPQDGLDLSTFKLQYWDGRNDNWTGGLRDVPWPGGCA